MPRCSKKKRPMFWIPEDYGYNGYVGNVLFYGDRASSDVPYLWWRRRRAGGYELGLRYRCTPGDYVGMWTQCNVHVPDVLTDLNHLDLRAFNNDYRKVGLLTKNDVKTVGWYDALLRLPEYIKMKAVEQGLLLR